MVRSRDAAEAGHGEAAAAESGRLGRSFVAAALLLAALLGACGIAPPPDTAGPLAPAIAAEVPARPAALRLPGKLDGLSAAEVVALMGEPDLRRVEPPAEIWQYRSAECVLEIFLYSDAGGTRVVHSETHDRGLIHADRCRVGGDAVTRTSRESRL